MNITQSRRAFLRDSLTLVAGGLALNTFEPLLAVEGTPAGAHPLFDGKTLTGWKAVPRISAPQHLMGGKVPPDELKAQTVAWYEADPERRKRLAHIGRWQVVDGAIVGGHEPPESQMGAYLLSEQKFADFELELDARPDWPADTGIMVRTHELGSIGFQILLDHRPKGG